MERGRDNRGEKYGNGGLMDFKRELEIVFCYFFGCEFLREVIWILMCVVFV